MVYPAAGLTKLDVVSYYDRIAPKMLPHVLERPISIKRFPKGMAAGGFFQKNVPPHYPESIRRFPIPRNIGETIYPLVDRADHLAYLANQGALELHVPTSRASAIYQPDRLIIDLDPPAGAAAKVQAAALLVRAVLEDFGLQTIPVATGSKGYHLVAAIEVNHDAGVLGLTLQKIGALLAAKYPDELTVAFRIALRGQRVFVDWMRNGVQATVIAPYSLRARPQATVAVPISWEELPKTAPDTFTLRDLERLLERPDYLAELTAQDATPFVERVEREFELSGLVLEVFDRFRS